MTAESRPVVDRTNCAAGRYILGGPCGRAGAYGPASGSTYYRATRADSAYTVTTIGEADPVLVETLTNYLTAPRRVRVAVFHYDRPGCGFNDSVKLTDHEVVVADGPDPDDYRAWSLWLEEYAGQWLADQESLGPGSYAALAIDPQAARLTGYQGYHCLSRQVHLAYIPA